MPEAPAERYAFVGSDDELAADPADGDVDYRVVAGAACQPCCPSEDVGWAARETPAESAGEQRAAFIVRSCFIIIRLCLWAGIWLRVYKFLRSFFWHNHRNMASLQAGRLCQASRMDR